MQKIFIIFLLSLSSCLSKPSEPQDVPKPAAPLIQEAKTDIPVSPTAVTKLESQTVQSSVKPTENVPQNLNVTNAQNLPGNATQMVPTNATKVDGDNKTSDKKEEVAPKAEVKKEETKNTTVIPAASEQSPKSEATPQETKAKVVEPSTQKNDVTPKPNATISSTVAPKADGGKPPVLLARGFDGPSFIGGIILTLGLLAIGFMGFKYYKNQTERNYHTL